MSNSRGSCNLFNNLPLVTGDFSLRILNALMTNVEQIWSNGLVIRHWGETSLSQWWHHWIHWSHCICHHSLIAHHRHHRRIHAFIVVDILALFSCISRHTANVSQLLLLSSFLILKRAPQTRDSFLQLANLFLVLSVQLLRMAGHHRNALHLLAPPFRSSSFWLMIVNRPASGKAHLVDFFVQLLFLLLLSLKLLLELKLFLVVFLLLQLLPFSLLLLLFLCSLLFLFSLSTFARSFPVLPCLSLMPEPILVPSPFIHLSFFLKSAMELLPLFPQLFSMPLLHVTSLLVSPLLF